MKYQNKPTSEIKIESKHISKQSKPKVSSSEQLTKRILQKFKEKK